MNFTQVAKSLIVEFGHLHVQNIWKFRKKNDSSCGIVTYIF